MAGDKTFAEMVDEVELAFGQRTDIATIAGEIVNDAYLRITCSNEIFGQRTNSYFPSLEMRSSGLNTSDGQAHITVPTDCLFIRHVWDSTNDVKLTKISLADYIQRTGRATASAEGKPQQWVRRSSEATGYDYVFLYPTPDAAYTIYIYYRARPAKLTGTSKTVIGMEWDEAIVTLACAITAQRLKDYEAVKMYKDEFSDIVTGLVGLYDNEDLDKMDYRKVDDTYINFKY